MSEAEPSRAAIARSYRAARTRELNELAEEAVGAPVLVAARFRPHSSWWVFSIFWKFALPIVGWFLLIRDVLAMRRVEGIKMLALDDERLHAIGARSPGSINTEPELLSSWERAEVRSVEVERAGNDDLVKLEIGAGGRRYRLYCSSLRTNPWASELVRRLGGAPPDPVGEPDTLGLADDASWPSDL